MEAREPAESAPWRRLLLEAGPLVVFFVANARLGIFRATAAFIVAVLIALVASYALERRLAVLPLVTAIFVAIFGGLTLWLNDDLFIKLKPTIVNGLFAAILLGGLISGRSLLKPLLGSSLQLKDEAWRALTLRWALFFALLALLNELVWRNTSTDAWVAFKVFGILPLTLVFALSQVPFLNRHQLGPAAHDIEPS